jgi:hypothetical protein
MKLLTELLTHFIGTHRRNKDINKDKQKSWPTVNATLSSGNYITIWGTALLGKLTVAVLTRKFPAFMEPKNSLPCSQQSLRHPELHFVPCCSLLWWVGSPRPSSRTETQTLLSVRYCCLNIRSYSSYVVTALYKFLIIIWNFLMHKHNLQAMWQPHARQWSRCLCLQSCGCV